MDVSAVPEEVKQEKKIQEMIQKTTFDLKHLQKHEEQLDLRQEQQKSRELQKKIASATDNIVLEYLMKRSDVMLTRL